MSAVSLIEIGLLADAGAQRIKTAAQDIYGELANYPVFEILPFTLEVASEFAAVGRGWPDVFDPAIVATARVHGLTPLTSDQRIIESKLVRAIE